MPHRRTLLLALAALALALTAAAPARAGFFVQPLDGPSADIQSLGGVDVARDAGGAVVYVRRDGGVDHVYAQRFFAGRFAAPERLDPGLAGPSSQPVVAAAEGGRIAVAFVNAGTLYGVVRPAGAAAWGAPTALDGAGNVSNPDIDMGISGVAYVVYARGADVAAVRLDNGVAWSGVPAPLDLAPAHAAGNTAATHPRVGVGADNVAVAVWGEEGDDGRTHVYERRIFGTAPSAYPAEASVDSLAGTAGGPADSADLDVEYDSSFAWVVFREVIGGHSRALARRLAGLTFDPPVALDALPTPSGEGGVAPRIAMTGTGQGLAFAGRDASFQTIGSVLDLDMWAPGRVDSVGSASTPVGVPAVGENFEGVLAWWRTNTAGTPGEMRARAFTPEPNTFAPEAVISSPDLGGVDPALGIDASADRAGNAVIAFIQGSGADRRLVASLYDRPPGRGLGLTTDHWQRTARPRLRWRPADDLWGPVTYSLLIDGQSVATTAATQLIPTARVPDGQHTWQLLTTDLHGQQTPGKARPLRIDTRKPRLRVRRRGRKVTVTATDGARARASGVVGLTIAFGDGARSSASRGSVTHAYRPGKWRLRATARDAAGNVATVTKRLRIK
jgi:hypothetical protein